MRVLWISFLLIGSITCGPVGEGSGQNNAVPNKPGSNPWGQYDRNPKDAEAETRGYVGYGSEVYTVPEVAAHGVPYAYQQEGSYQRVSAPGDETGNSGSAIDYVGEPQPVFSDVSDLEPVYSFSSRSRYQRGRATFVQTHYSPGDPFFPPMPVYNPPMKTGSKQSSPVKAPPKGRN